MLLQLGGIAGVLVYLIKYQLTVEAWSYNWGHLIFNILSSLLAVLSLLAFFSNALPRAQVMARPDLFTEWNKPDRLVDNGGGTIFVPWMALVLLWFIGYIGTAFRYLMAVGESLNQHD